MSSATTTTTNHHPDGLRIRDFLVPNDPTSWDNAWKANFTPWDAGHVQPPLKEIIDGGELPFAREGRALVPGCGQGLDAIYIAGALGLDTLGIDAATTAIDKANGNARSKRLTNINFELGDFFVYDTEDKFDLVYDYTFFVAIPPHLRPSWGTQMRALIKPGGYLITLIYPLDSSPPPVFESPPEGPPYHVRVGHYAEVPKEGEAFVRVVDRVPEVWEPSTDEERRYVEKHRGRDRLVVWRRV